MDKATYDFENANSYNEKTNERFKELINESNKELHIFIEKTAIASTVMITTTLPIFIGRSEKLKGFQFELLVIFWSFLVISLFSSIISNYFNSYYIRNVGLEEKLNGQIKLKSTVLLHKDFVVNSDNFKEYSKEDEEKDRKTIKKYEEKKLKLKKLGKNHNKCMKYSNAIGFGSFTLSLILLIYIFYKISITVS